MQNAFEGGAVWAAHRNEDSTLAASASSGDIDDAAAVGLVYLGYIFSGF